MNSFCSCVAFDTLLFSHFPVRLAMPQAPFAIRVLRGFLLGIGIAAGTLTVAGCAPHHEPLDTRPEAPRRPYDAGPDAGGIVVSEVDGGAGGCNQATIYDPNPSANHVAPGTPLVYASMPPVGGDHYGLWADYQNYTYPIDHGYLVHSLEHGAVIFFYRCAAREACPGLASDLETLAETVIPQDPLCAPYPHVRRRIIVVPEPNLTSVVAASAWRHGLALHCVDLAALAAFTLAHYDRATESLCAPGIAPPPRQ